MNYKLIAVQVGDALKYDSTVNEINRIGGAIFGFTRDDFPNASITSERAQLVHDWILSLATQRMDNEERNRQLHAFCERITRPSIGPRSPRY